MEIRGGTLLDMDKNKGGKSGRDKDKKKVGRPPGRTPSVPIFTRVRTDIGTAFLDHVDTIRPETTIKAVLEIAMEEYLASRGLWPPPT